MRSQSKVMRSAKSEKLFETLTLQGGLENTLLSQGIRSYYPERTLTKPNSNFNSKVRITNGSGEEISIPLSFTKTGFAYNPKRASKLSYSIKEASIRSKYKTLFNNSTSFVNKPFKPRGSTKIRIERLLTQIDPLSGINCGMKTYSGQEANQIKTNMDRMIRVKGKVFFT